MALRNPTTGPRIVPFGKPRSALDKLTNGRPAFRVTQSFGHPDAFLGGIHGAMDIANYNAGDVMLASVNGIVLNFVDVYGALITEIHEPNGNVVGYGHLRAFARPHASQVSRGTVIGWVGNTGLSTSAHCHMYRLTAGGTRRDPWPELEQNQVAPSPSKKYVKFNDGVDGVNIRDKPDARPGKSKVFAVAFKDPKGIVRTHNGQKIGNTSARRTLYGVVKGADGFDYNKLKIYGTTAYTYVQSRFQHEVPG